MGAADCAKAAHAGIGIPTAETFIRRSWAALLTSVRQQIAFAIQNEKLAPDGRTWPRA